VAWRTDEVWLDTEVLWFREQPRRPFGAITLPQPALAGDALEPAPFLPIATGLEASRQRRLEARAARKRRLATRTVPAVALVVGSATMLPIAAFRHGSGGQAVGPLQEDPPSLTFGLEQLLRDASAAQSRKPDRAAAHARAQAREFARVAWRHASSLGLPYSGRLVDGTQLPVDGPDWVTWDPITDSSPNLPNRLYGNERTIRAILSVTAAYRAAHPDAPRVVVGDISRRDGGQMNEHVSHQNGLDVDVYYPRRDRRLVAPTATRQIDRRLAQELLDRFLAAGAQVVFVGYSTGLSGPSGVVVPYPNHENHMHVRFPRP
jgi:penicillin-insensitive murein endopeptidase